MVAVSSWGRLSQSEHQVHFLTHRHPAPVQIRETAPGLAHGMGRSYGDAALNPGGCLWNTTSLDRFISLDERTGQLACETGVLLRDIQRLMMPRGWILPVTPGTQLITVGGAIANDVHGKNHHVLGCFGDHVLRLTLLRTDGEIIECGPDLLPDWFAATVGGIGLTGVILSATIQLRRIAGPWLNTETIAYASLDQFFQQADDSEADWEHTVSWIDCCVGSQGRGLFMRGNPVEVENRAEPRDRSFGMPFVPPFSLVNRWSLRLFNAAYFNLKKRKAAPRIMHYQPFFYPLDNLLEWNRMYGPKGFFQYQCVVPRETGDDAIQAMLGDIARSGEGSFLAVLKTFGNRQPVGMLSFPQPGVTLALDFSNKAMQTAQLFARLDAIVREAGGRIYLAKDARMPRDLFEAGYPRLNEFLPYRDRGISSAMSRRLMGF
ncbi:MAG: FAD-binding oxidoreductase [Methylococcales bacterium]|nr:FAD-binding oxidoreductase [Methylococcales bacterium]